MLGKLCSTVPGPLGGLAQWCWWRAGRGPLEAKSEAFICPMAKEDLEMEGSVGPCLRPLSSVMGACPVCSLLLLVQDRANHSR